VHGIDSNRFVSILPTRFSTMWYGLELWPPGLKLWPLPLIQVIMQVRSWSRRLSFYPAYKVFLSDTTTLTLKTRVLPLIQVVNVPNMIPKLMVRYLSCLQNFVCYDTTLTFDLSPWISIGFFFYPLWSSVPCIWCCSHVVLSWSLEFSIYLALQESDAKTLTFDNQ
jgi:hypothetical protein